MIHMPRNTALPYVLLTAIILLYTVLIVPMIPQIGISFDEQTDLTIAQSYDAAPQGWLRGSDLDATNVRLPMYSSWLLFNLSDNPLHAARLVGCLLGILTLVAVFLYCRREFSIQTGLIACLIMAISPYFLSFSRVAFTEGDIFITCLASWLLYLVTALKREQTLKWVLACGLCLGLVLSAKASGAALVVAATLSLLLPTAGRLPLPPAPVAKFGLGRTVLCLGLLSLGLLVVAGGYYLAGPADLEELPAAYQGLSKAAVLGHYLCALGLWLLVLLLLGLKRKHRAGYLGSPLLVLALAAVTFLVLPPVHITNPTILTSLAAIFTSSNDAFSWAFAGEAAVLHFLVLLLKSGLIMGIGLCLGIVAALCQWQRRPALRTPLIFFLLYLAFLILKMVHAQTYFMMPLFPVAAILLADLVQNLLGRYRRTAWILIAAALVTTTIDLVRTYPYTHLNGYQWLGARYLGGRSTIGYRSVAQTPSDGLEQACRWMRENIPPGERILHFTHADHILRPRMEHRGLINLNGFHPAYTMEEVNYLMIHINGTINDGRGRDNPEGSIYRYYYDPEKLEQEFVKIYSLKRPFNIEVVSVWYRKHPYPLGRSGKIIGPAAEGAAQRRHPVVP